MSLPELPNTRNPRELRKALLRLRMEMHRQEIRHESGQLMEPLRRVRGMGSSLHDGLGIKHAPLWGLVPWWRWASSPAKACAAATWRAWCAWGPACCHWCACTCKATAAPEP